MKDDPRNRTGKRKKRARHEDDLAGVADDDYGYHSSSSDGDGDDADDGATHSVSKRDSDLADQPMLEVGPSEVSLRCPLSFKRITFPVKGSRCQHDSCFELAWFIRSACAQGSWDCPHCGGAAYYSELRLATVVHQALKVLALEEAQAKGSDQVPAPLPKSTKSKHDNSDDEDEEDEEGCWAIFLSPDGSWSKTRPDAATAVAPKSTGKENLSTGSAVVSSSSSVTFTSNTESAPTRPKGPPLLVVKKLVVKPATPSVPARPPPATNPTMKPNSNVIEIE